MPLGLDLDGRLVGSDDSIRMLGPIEGGFMASDFDLSSLSMKAKAAFETEACVRLRERIYKDASGWFVKTMQPRTYSVLAQRYGKMARAMGFDSIEELIRADGRLVVKESNKGKRWVIDLAAFADAYPDRTQWGALFQSYGFYD